MASTDNYKKEFDLVPNSFFCYLTQAARWPYGESVYTFNKREFDEL